MVDRKAFVRTFLELGVFLALLYLLYIDALSDVSLFGYTFFAPDSFPGLEHYLKWIHNSTELNFFGYGPFYPVGHVAPLFLLYLTTFVVHAVVPERWRKTVLLCAGLLGGLFAYPRELVAVIGLVLLVYFIIHKTGRNTKLKLLLLGALYIGLGYGSSQSSYVQLAALVFVGLTFFRTLLYLHAMALKKYPATPIADYLRFQLPLASFIIHPYLGVIPPYTSRRAPRPLEALFQDGRKLLWGGIGALVAARLFSRATGLLFVAPPVDLLSIHFLSVLKMIVMLLDTAACAGFLVGLMLLLGWDLKPAMERPWFSASLFEYWNRFIIHFKDLQVTLFYYPTVLALRRMRREVAIVVAVAMTFLVGNDVVHILGRYIYTRERETLLPHGVKANFVLAGVMTLAFLWEEYKQERKRAGKPVPLQGGGILARGIKICLTLSIVSWVWNL